MKQHIFLLGLLGTMLTLNGCVVGPDFRTPNAPAVLSYTESDMPSQTVSATDPEIPGGTVQRFVDGKALPERWWTLFKNKPLNRVIDAALANSPTLAQAEARLRQAQAQYDARTGATRYPGVDARVSATRQQVDFESMGITTIPSPPPFTLYNASVTVSYTFDWFGVNARSLEGLQAAVEAERYQWQAARLTLAANIATAVIRDASLLAQIEAMMALIDAQKAQLEIFEARRALGGVAEADVQSLRGALANNEARLPPLQQQRYSVRHQVAVYLNQTPAESMLPTWRLAGLHFPETLPLTLPSEWVRQRPDIRAAEAMLHQASTNVGVATANLYPRLTLSGAMGSDALSVEKLFADGLNVWSLGAGITQPLFHGGELRAYKRSAEAALVAAEAGYRQTVLQGFQNVADVLRALETDAQKLQACSVATQQSLKTYQLMRARYDLGGVDQWAVLDAEKQYQQALLTQIQATADRYANTVALFQAMGAEFESEEGKIEARND